MADTPSSTAHDSCEVGASTTELIVLNILPTTRNPKTWANWDLCEMSNGKQKARCKHCGTFLAAGANSTLDAHIKNHCKVLKGSPISGQSQMSKQGGMFNYNVDKVRKRMAQFVIQQGLPFNHFDNQRLTSLIRDTLQPSYSHVSRTTLRKHCINMWKEAKEQLIL